MGLQPLHIGLLLLEQAGFALWRSVYLSKQYGMRNRILVAVDWAKARAFGRDLSRF